jgi:hypothetical protein
MGRRQLFRSIAIACLALLAALLLRLDWSQVALSWNRPTFNILTNRPTSAGYMPANEFREEKKLVAANYEDALDEAKKQFICFKASQKYSIPEFQNFKPKDIQTKIVSPLANELSDCVRQNRRNIDFVDLKNLFRVIYTTKLLQDSNKAIVIVGVGSPSQIPARAQFSEGIVDFLAANTNKNQSSVTLSGSEVNNGVIKVGSKENEGLKIPVPRLGNIVIKNKGNIYFPKELRFSGNQTSLSASLSIAHDLDDGTGKFTAPPNIQEGTGGFPLFQLTFDANASDFDQQLMSGRRKELASAELIFSGLLLKGIPEYIDYRRPVLKADLKLDDIKTIDYNKNKIAFIKKVGIPGNKQLEDLNNFQKKLNKELSSFQKLQEKAKNQPNNANLNAQLTASKNELANILSDKAKVLESIYKFEFQCAPTFERIVDFNIWGKNVSTNNGNSSGNQPTSANANVGVKGKVVIDIRNPTCTVSIVPPYSSISTTYADISITSSGRFGAGAEASAQASNDFNLKFKDKYKPEYTPKNLMRLSPDEREFIDTSSRRIFKEVKSEVKNRKDLIDKIEKNIEDQFLDKVLNPDLEKQIVNELSNNLKGFCNRYANELTKELGVDGKQLCWAAKYVTAPEAIAARLLEFEKQFSGLNPGLAVEQACKLGNSLPKCTVRLKDPITGITVEREVPGCALEREIKMKNCALWNNQKNDWENTIRAQYLLYKTPNKVREIVGKFVRKSIFLPSKLAPSFSTKLAQQAVDIALDAEREFHSINDSLPLQPSDLLNLLLTVKTSADARLTSVARILETRPAFNLRSTLMFPEPNKQPTLKVIGVFDANYQDKSKTNMEGKIGGLRPLNLDLTATIEAKQGDKVLHTMSNKVLKESEIFDEKSIDLNNQEYNNQTLIDESVPLN